MSLGLSGLVFRSGLFEYTPRRVYTSFTIDLCPVILPVLFILGSSCIIITLWSTNVFIGPVLLSKEFSC